MDRWNEAAFEVFTSVAILQECRRVLQYDRLRRFHKLDDEQIEATIEALRHLAVVVEPAEPIEAVEEDPSDDKFLECAVAANADFIVSGDRYLLALKEYRGTRIVTPAEFLDVLES